MSLARRHRDKILAAQHAAAVLDFVAAVPDAAPLPASGTNLSSAADRAAAQIALRLTHDLRRLKEIKSIDLKIAAKREMLPEYRDWVAGLIAADAGVGTGTAAEVLPTIMVWLIDTGAYSDALDLVPFMFTHRVAMPTRYQRDAATIVVEEIADAANKAQGAGASFPLDILDRVADLTEAHDIHDEVRAKLFKAIGTEELTVAEDMEAGPAARARLTVARNSLREAQRLHSRIGVTTKLKKAEKLIAANLAAFPPEDEQRGDDAA